MIIFHKQVKQWRDDWYEHLPPVIWRGPTGTLLTVMIIVFGAISILIGVTQLLLAFVSTLKMTHYPLPGSDLIWKFSVPPPCSLRLCG